MNYCIMATYKCNWDCPYCITNTHSQKEVTREMLIEKLNEIQPNSEVSISGGEPGLLTKESIDLIFNDLIEKNCKIKVNTNGLFFKKYQEYDSKIYSYLYHFSDNLNLNEDCFIPDIDKNKITFMLVITNENCARLGDFLEKYNQIKFSLFAAVKNNLEDDRYILSKRNAFDIFKKYKHTINGDSYKTLLMTPKETDCNKTLNRL